MLKVGIVMTIMSIVVMGSAITIGFYNYAKRWMFSASETDRNIGRCMIIFSGSIALFVIGIFLIGVDYLVELFY